MNNRSQNLGMSSISLLALLVVIAFLGVCAFKVTPLYYDNIMLKSTMEGIDKPVGAINDWSNAEVREALQKAFAVNAIELDPRDVIISRENNRTTISYDYEARTELFYNISVMAHFETQYPAAP
jgi:hypothetical protein